MDPNPVLWIRIQCCGSESSVEDPNPVLWIRILCWGSESSVEDPNLVLWIRIQCWGSESSVVDPNQMFWILIKFCGSIGGLEDRALRHAGRARKKTTTKNCYLYPYGFHGIMWHIHRERIGYLLCIITSRWKDWDIRQKSFYLLCLGMYNQYKNFIKILEHLAWN